MKDIFKKAVHKIKGGLQSSLRNATFAAEKITHLTPEELGITDQILPEYCSIGVKGNSEALPKFVAKRDVNKVLGRQTWRIYERCDEKGALQNIKATASSDAVKEYSTYKMFEIMNHLEGDYAAENDIDLSSTVYAPSHFSMGQAIYEPARKKKRAEISKKLGNRPAQAERKGETINRGR